jgi:hypothetical protein
MDDIPWLALDDVALFTVHALIVAHRCERADERANRRYN